MISACYVQELANLGGKVLACGVEVKVSLFGVQKNSVDVVDGKISACGVQKKMGDLVEGKICLQLSRRNVQSCSQTVNVLNVQTQGL
jgi:hypothetical protein